MRLPGRACRQRPGRDEDSVRRTCRHSRNGTRAGVWKVPPPARRPRPVPSVSNTTQTRPRTNHKSRATPAPNPHEAHADTTRTRPSSDPPKEPVLVYARRDPAREATDRTAGHEREYHLPGRGHEALASREGSHALPSRAGYRHAWPDPARSRRARTRHALPGEAKPRRESPRLAGPRPVRSSHATTWEAMPCLARP
jgi:hypothetical protein